ncbi:hypothetical protein BDZ45DRAFT_736084 [Acephala macrosclerotiorum]|nr:hypothetical protein BDZ45DRAFT_736084 [Acephala macrosclerotiorum]
MHRPSSSKTTTPKLELRTIFSLVPSRTQQLSTSNKQQRDYTIYHNIGEVIQTFFPREKSNVPNAPTGLLYSRRYAKTREATRTPFPGKNGAATLKHFHELAAYTVTVTRSNPGWGYIPSYPATDPETVPVEENVLQNSAFNQNTTHDDIYNNEPGYPSKSDELTNCPSQEWSSNGFETFLRACLIREDDDECFTGRRCSWIQVLMKVTGLWGLWCVSSLENGEPRGVIEALIGSE